MKKKVFLIVIAVIIVLFVGFIINNTFSNTPTNRESENLDWRYSEIKNVLGPCDSYFEGYEIYHEKGIRVKFCEIPEVDENGWKGYHYSRTGNVENIIFDEKYTDELFPGVGVGMEWPEIQNSLGTPDFLDESRMVFGYIRPSCYVFFSGENKVTQVSVYPRYSKYDSNVIMDTIGYCAGKDLTPELAREVVSMLEDQWPDYNYAYSISEHARYSKRSNSAGIAYYAKGIEVYYDSEATSLFHIYENFDGEISNKDVIGSEIVEFHKGTDFVFEQEKRRILAEKELHDRIKKEGVLSPDGNRVLLDNSQFNGIDVVYPNNEAPNYCIQTSPLQYGAAHWLSNRYILYMYGKDELRVYDLENNQYQRICRDVLDIQSVQNGCITITSVSGEDSVIQFQVNEQDEIIFSNADGTPLESIEHWIDGKLENEWF